ncbi:MAG: C-terminal binding protein [Planctomycetes bacterium]|nr:C-terminal binding protein [Planctomycetota bacterium]
MVVRPERSPLQVLITDRAWADVRIEREILAEIGAEVIEPPASDEASLIAAAASVDAIATCWAPVTAAVIAAAPHLRAIARFGIGLDNIAVEAATARGIPVTRVPDYCVDEVSDHALALVLTFARKTAFYDRLAKRGRYELAAGPPLRRLSRQTLGLVGLGRIARALVPKARALGMQVIAHTPSGDACGTGCEMVGFEDLLARSDFVSLHAPLCDSTRRLVDDHALSRMKPTAVLINTSRGGLVDTEALWRAIEAGRLAGAALDVFDPEPPDLDHPLYRDERVLVTPHAAFLSEESLVELRTRTARSLVEVLCGRRPEHVANPQVYQSK